LTTSKKMGEEARAHHDALSDMEDACGGVSDLLHTYVGCLPLGGGVMRDTMHHTTSRLEHAPQTKTKQ
jgi:hypothetical protein